MEISKEVKNLKQKLFWSREFTFLKQLLSQRICNDLRRTRYILQKCIFLLWCHIARFWDSKGVRTPSITHCKTRKANLIYQMLTHFYYYIYLTLNSISVFLENKVLGIQLVSFFCRSRKIDRDMIPPPLPTDRDIITSFLPTTSQIKIYSFNLCNSHTHSNIV